MHETERADDGHALRRSPIIGASQVSDEDIAALVEISDRLRSRSLAAQKAAVRASVLLHEAVAHSIRLCGR